MRRPWMMSMKATSSQKVSVRYPRATVNIYHIHFRLHDYRECLVCSDDLLRLAPKLDAPSRAMLHDPMKYPNPESFIPERFLMPSGQLKEDPDLTVAFGFGRRSVMS